MLHPKKFQVEGWPRPYMRDGVAGLTRERQEAMLLDAGINLADGVWVDRLTRKQIKVGDPKALKDRDAAIDPKVDLRPGEVVCVASLRVLGWGAADLARAVARALERSIKIHCIDTGETYSTETPRETLLRALANADEAARRERIGSAARLSQAAAVASRQRNIERKLVLARELWLKPSEEISVSEIARQVGLSRRTLYDRLGSRSDARDGKVKHA